MIIFFPSFPSFHFPKLFVMIVLYHHFILNSSTTPGTFCLHTWPLHSFDVFFFPVSQSTSTLIHFGIPFLRLSFALSSQTHRHFSSFTSQVPTTSLTLTSTLTYKSNKTTRTLSCVIVNVMDIILSQY